MRVLVGQRLRGEVFGRLPVRLQGAGASTIHTSNINDNAYGVFNVGLDGATANTGTPVNAENNYWGLRTNATLNAGPVVSPTTNPPYQENPVNGTATVDATCLNSSNVAVPGSDTVDFCPFRNGNQADPNAGQFPVAYAPLPVSDAGPSVSLSTDSATYDRGDAVTMTANASDDFGIAKITFYDGADQVAVAVPPADEGTFTIPADAACAARTLTAVAEDSIGQTASDTETITVVGPNGCSPPPQPPSQPSVQLTGVPATIDPASGAAVGATATVDPTLTASKVEFKLGTRTVCTDTAAPFTCDILPNGDEVGSQTVQAVLTDSASQTATDSADTTVGRFTPNKLTIDIKKGKSKKKKKKKGKKKLIRTIQGEVYPPNRVTKDQGCSTGTVTLTVEENGNTLFPLTQVPLGSDCTYSLTFKVPKTKKHKFAVDASFGGNSVLLPTSNSKRFK